jgi:NAD(P)H-flavin reductase
MQQVLIFLFLRLKRCRTRNVKYPTRPNNFLEQAYATGTAICREISYPQFLLENRWFQWLSPPSLGRVLFLACYWAIVAYMMTNTAIINDAYYWERIGFRNAWISVTQVPLVYLLAAKSNVIGWIIGSSHERLNWLHRWVSRTLLISVTVHGSFFMREWVRADFVNLELAMMPMVKYGIGAWAILVWTFFTSLSPLRSMAYEIFVLQHIAAAGIFLWLLWIHVPTYAVYNIWFAIGAISFDWILRMLLAVYRNVRLRRTHSCNGTEIIGHQVELQAVGSDVTVLTIKDVHLSWKAGQHLYLWVPRLGLLESHPFTIATPCTSSKGCHCNEIQLAIKAQAGFSRRIYQYAVNKQRTARSSLIGFIAGPYGVPPKWEAYETLVLISASTGASFTLPILESILDNPGTICTQRIKFLLVVRERSHIDYYVKRLSDALANAETVGISLDVEIAVTDNEGSLGDDDTVGRVQEDHHSHISEDEIEELKEGGSQQPYVLVKSHSPSSSTSSRYKPSPEKACCGAEDGEKSKPLLPLKSILYSYGRPDIASFIRLPVEMTGGETSIAVCGGKSLVTTVRNSVARLSDERAVHKGTGAQGIHLHVEEYCFKVSSIE